jgi:hypothetical protein
VIVMKVFRFAMTASIEIERQPGNASRHFRAMSGRRRKILSSNMLGRIC